MGKAGVWGAIACLALAACAESKRADSGFAAACFAGRELESWDEPRGAPCSVEHDWDADGVSDQTLTNEYDERGRFIEGRLDGELVEEVDYDDERFFVTTVRYSPDGEVISRIIEQRDERGNVMVRQEDSDGDGKIDSVFANDYSCWQGAPIVYVGACVAQLDEDADGTFDVTWTTDWDDQDREVLTVEHSEDGSSAHAITYADDGSWRRTEIDYGNDGSPDIIFGVEYDDDGHPIRSWYDNDLDGEEDSFTERDYDSKGRQTRELRVTLDGDEHLTEWTYSEDGLRVSETVYRDPMAALSHVLETRLDRAGNILAEVFDSEGDGEADSCTHYSYACRSE
jgi:hypothetical protein